MIRRLRKLDAALKTGNTFYIYTKDPSVQAFTDLMNRALDKPAEQVKHTGEDSGPVMVIYQWRATNEHEGDDDSV